MTFPPAAIVLCCAALGVGAATLPATAQGAPGSTSAAPATPAPEHRPDRFAHVYVGQWSDNAFNRIIRLETDFRSSWVGAAGVVQRVGDLGPVALDAEVQAAQHWGRQRHQEINAGLMLRWVRFPWDARADTSLAYGLGISHAFHSPPLERLDDGRLGARTLAFMVLEITVEPSASSPWLWFTRVHHRSSAFDFFGEARGTNFISLGLRRRY